MQITNMPGCCTSAIIHGFGEHGEHALVTPAEIERQIAELLDHQPHKQTLMAISVARSNQATLKAAGFREIYNYPGIQGLVRVMVKSLKSYPRKRNVNSPQEAADIEALLEQ